MSESVAAELPLVSVSITTHNRVGMVTHAVDSVLAQDYYCFEVIICDDGSTDGTGEVIRARYGDRVTYLYQDNQGPAAARCATIRHTRGEYIALMDDDDIWLPGKLSLQVAALQQHPEAGLCYGLCLAGTPDGQRTERPHGQSHRGRSGDVFGLFLHRNVIMEPAVMVRRSVLEEVGGFDPAMAGGKDTDLFLRIALRHQAVYLREPLMVVRQHQGRRTRSIENRLRAPRARARTMEKLLGMLPPERERFRPTLARRLVAARAELLKLMLREMDWEALCRELEALYGEAGELPVQGELAQAATSALCEWTRAHAGEPERPAAASPAQLADRLAATGGTAGTADRAARLRTALGLGALRQGRVVEGLRWMARGASYRLQACLSHLLWAAGRAVRRL